LKARHAIYFYGRDQIPSLRFYDDKYLS